jgi:signal transduction histidine kinase
MNWIRNLPIRSKIILIIMVTSGAALLTASVAWITYDVVQARLQLEQTVRTISAIIADNTTASLTFKDPESATDTLDALKAEPFFVAACVYGDEGVFATFVKSAEEHCPASAPQDGSTYGDDYLGVTTPILLEGKPIGRVYIRTTLDPVNARLNLELATVGTILIATALFAFVLSSWLQRFISRPILSLARTAHAVSEKQDYSLRAVQEYDDELGMLVKSFNGMLAQIQARDQDLLQAKEALEKRVSERTAELAERNTELAASNRELDDFAYIASHDLKEPLRGMHNYSNFLLEDYADKLDEEGIERLRTLVRLSQRMEHLINSLLEYSRVGRVDLAMESVNLNEILADVVDSLQIQLTENNVTLRIPRPLPRVICDRVRVGEVFQNLITNGMKYNDRSEKWIEIGYTDGKPPVFYVRDNGIGISPKHQDSIFRIFKRLHSRDKYGGGSGAGLTIVRKIIERHAGKIWLDSTVGEGTTFYFTLQGDNQDHARNNVARRTDTSSGR